ncbi:MAG: alpha/beta hydrolase [Pseudomonadota bacterium]
MSLRPAAALAALLVVLPWTAPGAAPAARVALADCRLPHPAGLATVPARCGSVNVPENPAESGGRRITLRVAVVPALDRRSEREPLFIVSGGPGQAATDFYAAYASAFATIQRTRDLVLLDQRGTGGSNPLDCDFPDDVDTTRYSPELLRQLSAQCRQALRGRPEFYTTSVAVQDLDRVRVALGYERIALYGISYGTRVVQHYVRRFPSSVHAVVLDGVVAPGEALGVETPFDSQRALDAMFRRCEREAACAKAFPDLARRFDELRGRLADQPVKLTLPDPANAEPREVEFGNAQLVGAVRLLNYQSATTALLPLLLDRASRGDYAPLAGQLLLIGRSLDSQIAYGMNAAVACTEDVPGYSTVNRDSLARTYFGTTQVDGLLALCDGWPRGVVDADFAQPLRSAVPALLLSGEFDPVTPPRSGEAAAKGFADARHVVVRGQGHGQITEPCAARVVASFLDLGTARGLDASCLDAAGPAPFFVDAAGPTP